MRINLFFFTLLFGYKIFAAVPYNIIFNLAGIQLKSKLYFSEWIGNLPTLILLQGFPGNETDVLGFGYKISQAAINVIKFNYSSFNKT
jgi:hypothetical protein